MVNWDPGSGSAISDLEVEEREDRHPLLDRLSAGRRLGRAGRRHRPSGDDAGRQRGGGNPADERYAHLVGSEAVLPLVGRALPVIADDYVKTDFGTGALKVTPGHDPNDFEIGRRHGLRSTR